MEVWEAIRTRRTLHSFRPDPVPQAVVEEVLEAATWAPSHRNTQPWEFLLLGPQTRKKLAPVLQQRLEEGPLKRPELPEARKQVLREFGRDFGGAPVLVAVVCQPGDTEMERDEFPQAVAAAVQNLLLAAWARGLGSVWLSVGRSPEARDILGIREGYSVVAVVPLGYPNAEPQAPPRLPVREKLATRP